MEVDAPATCEKKRFEIKKWNAVALWAWDIVVDNCAICRNHIMGKFFKKISERASLQLTCKTVMMFVHEYS